MHCLDDMELQALMDGSLEGERLRSADAHLDACTSCREIVTALARSERAEVEVEAGASIGRYIVLDTIGGGAMGIVLSAYDRELDRKIALKVLRADAAPDLDAARDRIRREAQAMARLSHPNVVHVYEVGTSGERVFVAMELVEGGRTMRSWLDEERRSPAEVLALFVQAGRGLAAAHDAGLVHRDFKPENVVVGPGERARVTDFGLASGSLGASGEPVDEIAAVTITRTGVLIGTPAYMAPEQLDAKSADAKSDQFSFCVALFEGLFGARPFGGGTIRELRASMAEPPKFRSSRAIPSYVTRALARGLSIDPKDRFPDMRALLEALEPRASRSLVWLALAMLGAIAVGATVFATVGSNGPCEDSERALAGTWSEARSREVADALGDTRSARFATTALDAWAARWIGDHQHVCRATRVSGEQSDALLDARMACLESARRRAGAIASALESASARELEPEAIAEALPEAGFCRSAALPTAPPPAGARARIAAIERTIDGARAAAALGQIQRARRLSERAVREARAVRWAPLTADAELARAQALRGAGLLGDAERAAYASLFAAEESGDGRRAAEAWIALVGVAGERRDDARAAHLGRHARAVLARIGRPRRLTAALSNDLGAVLTRLSRYDEAHRALEHALLLSRDEHGEASPQVARVRTNLGNLARAESDLERAIEEHRTALAIDRRALGDDHPAVARHHHNLAGIFRVLGRREEAREHYEQALAIKRAALGDEHLEVALTENSLGLLESELGHADLARAHYRRALAILARHRHADEATVATNLAILEEDEAALALFERALARLGDDGSPEEIVRASIGAAERASALGRPREARAHAERAVTTAESAGFPVGDAVRELTRAPEPTRPAAPRPSSVSPSYLPATAFDRP